MIKKSGLQIIDRCLLKNYRKLELDKIMSDFNWNKMVPELTCTDFKKSLKFYVDIIGFEIVNRRTEPCFAYLNLNDVQIMIQEFHSSGWNVAELEYPFGRGINLQMEFDDINEIYASLKNNNYPFFRDIKETWYQVGDNEDGQLEFLVLDPDGYLLRFTKYLGSR